MTQVMLYFALPMIGSIFIMYSIFYSMDRIGTNVTVNRFAKSLTVAGYILVSIAISLLGNGVINLLVMLIIPVIGHYFYNNNRIYLIYYVGLITAVYLTDILATVGLSLIISNGIIYYIDPQAYYIILVVTVRFIEFMVLRLLVGVIQRMLHEQITKKQMLGSFLLPLYSILNLFSMLFFLQTYTSGVGMVLLTVNIAVLVILNIYFTSVFDVICRNNHLENELNLYKQQQEIQVRYYESLEQKYDSSRKLIHDIRNHIQAMESLYEIQKNSEGCGYARDVHAMLNQLGQKYYTDNKILNIILNDKVQTMRAHGIMEDIKISMVELGFIRDVDITTLFANILDNAIEAARASEEKQLILRLATVHDFITITLKNSTAQKPVRQGNSFLSTKNDHEGLGLKNVERVVKNYKGDIQYEWGDTYFITRIMFAN